MEISRRWIWISTLSFAACASTAGVKREPPIMAEEQRPAEENTRLANAELMAETVQGNLNFEQMPNSTLVTFRFEGLQPKTSYRVYIQTGDACRQPALEAASPLAPVRANREGIAENTFRTEDFSVSGSRSVLGQSIILARINPKSPKPAPMACALVRAGSSAILDQERTE